MDGPLIDTLSTMNLSELRFSLGAFPAYCQFISKFYHSASCLLQLVSKVFLD